MIIIVTNEARFVNTLAVKKQICVSRALCVSNRSCPHAKRMRRVILSSVICLALQYFSTFSHKRKFRKTNVIENKMCVLILPTNLSETLLILGRNGRDIIIMYTGLYVEYLLLLSDFNEL
jgi:hypothetical protein